MPLCCNTMGDTYLSITYIRSKVDKVLCRVLGDRLNLSVTYNLQNVFKVLMLFKEYFTILELSDMFWDLAVF